MLAAAAAGCGMDGHAVIDRWESGWEAVAEAVEDDWRDMLEGLTSEEGMASVPGRRPGPLAGGPGRLRLHPGQRGRHRGRGRARRPGIGPGVARGGGRLAGDGHGGEPRRRGTRGVHLRGVLRLMGAVSRAPALYLLAGRYGVMVIELEMLRQATPWVGQSIGPRGRSSASARGSSRRGTRPPRGSRGRVHDGGVCGSRRRERWREAESGSPDGAGSERPRERTHAFSGDRGLIGSEYSRFWGGCPPAILQQGRRRACLGDG